MQKQGNKWVPKTGIGTWNRLDDHLVSMSEGNHASWQLRYHILGGSLNLLASRDAFDSSLSANVLLPLKIRLSRLCMFSRVESMLTRTNIKLYFIHIHIAVHINNSRVKILSKD